MKNIISYKSTENFSGKKSLTINSISNIYNKSYVTNKLIIDIMTPINALASKPLITEKHDKILIYVFYYAPRKARLNINSINILGNVLETVFNKKVELRLVKHKYPYLNSYILAQYIAIRVRHNKFTKVSNRVLSSVAPVKNIIIKDNLYIPVSIIGLSIKVSGRLLTERSRPRETVQTNSGGSFSKHNIHKLDYALYTSKNKKGAYTIKVSINLQAFNN